MLNFYENGLAATFNSRYSAANTPIPYIIVAAVAKLSAPTLLVARIVTGVISLFTFFVAMKLLKAFGTSKYCYLVLLFFPYFFVNSFIFYAINYGLFFAVLALWVFYRSDNKLSFGTNLLTGVFLSLAVLAQQFYLMLPVAMMIPRFFNLFSQKTVQKSLTFGKMVLANVFLVLPLAVPFLIFLNWGGLTHPNFSQHSLSFYPSTIVAILFVTGFYCSPYVLQVIRQVSKWEFLISTGLAIILVLLFKPTFGGDFQGPGMFTGLTFRLISVAGKIHPVLTTVLMAALTTSGILIFIRSFRSLSSEFEYVLFTACLLLGLAYACNTEIGERHLLPLLMILFLLILPRMRKPFTVIFPAFVAFLGIGYFFYWNFMKFAS